MLIYKFQLTLIYLCDLAILLARWYVPCARTVNTVSITAMYRAQPNVDDVRQVASTELITNYRPTAPTGPT